VRGLPVWDRAAGAAVGVLGVATLLWMMIPSLATAEGWPARVSRGSTVVSWIDDLAPTQPSRFAAWGLRISGAPYPTALSALDEPPDPGLPPKNPPDPATDLLVRRSVVKVLGEACGQEQEGTGWVAERHLVVTNAHVVAGEPRTYVETSDGTNYDARVVAFDPDADIAVLQVPDLDAPPLKQADADAHEIGWVYGHPDGGRLRVAPARIGEEIRADGNDIYRTKDHVFRHVFILAARLRPGDSGAPFVNKQGAVVGVAFAIDPAHPGTAFALTDKEVTKVLATVVSGRSVPTRKCLL
jgi:S1-C subfamily serine protease